MRTDIAQLSSHSTEKSFYGAQKKFTTNNLLWLGPTTRKLLQDLNSAPFCAFIEALTGIDGIIPDNTYNGGGVHETKRGGFLKIHADFNWHSHLRLYRRVNLLIYLNRDWETAWGGQLELWDDAMKVREVSLMPAFNKMVIFTTSDTSFHGHPSPLMCPADKSRKSLALYYYTSEHTPQSAHRNRSVDTNYQARPDEQLTPDNKVHPLTTVAKNITPPIFTRALGRLLKNIRET